MHLRCARKTPLALAVIASLSASFSLHAQTFDVSGQVPLEFNSDLGESLTLAGTASASTDDLIDFGGIQIQGDVTNNANLDASGDSHSAIDVDASNITGTLTNNGNLNSQGNPATALNFGMSSALGIVNNGSIHSSGAMNPNDDETVDGLLIWDTQIGAGGILNTGEITAEGEDSFAVKIEFASHIDGDVRNDGLIQATGNRSTAIYIGDESSLTGELINNGTISASTTAIRFAPSSGPSFLQITQNGGLIEGGESAIDGNGSTTLNLNGGTVRGDIRGIFVINVLEDDAVIDSDLIQADFLEIYFTNPGKRLRLQRTHSELDGNLEFLSGNLELLVGQSTDPERAILNVSGRAEVGSDFTVLLTPIGNDFNTATEGRNYKLIQAQSWFKEVEDSNGNWHETALDGDELTVQSTSALLEVLSYSLNTTTLTALLKAHTGQEAADVIANAGGDQNAQNAVSSFSVLLADLSADDPIFQAFANADAAQTRRLAEQLAPELNGAVSQVAASNYNLLGNALQNRSASLRRGLSSGDGLSQTGVWLQVLDSDVDQGSRNGVPGYDADSQGIAVGADGKLNAQTTLGLAYSYLSSDVRSQNGNKIDLEGHTLTLYSAYQQDAWFADASLSYGLSDNQSTRYIADTRAKGDYDSSLWGLSLLGGYGFELGQGVLLEPRVAARYINVQIDSYREKGSSAALAVGEQRIEIAELGAGLRLAGNFAVGQGNLEPEAKLMAYHDFIADQASSTSAFVAGGTPFVTHGAKPARDSFEASLGLTYRLGAVSLGLSYDYLTKADYTADTVQAKVRYDF